MPENNEGISSGIAISFDDEYLRRFRELYQTHIEVMMQELGVWDYKLGFKPKNQLKYETVETSLP